MQLLSLVSVGPEAQRLLEDVQKTIGPVEMQTIWIALGIFLGGAILSSWLASQMVIKQRAGFGRAIAAGFLLVVSFLVVAALVGTALYFAMSQGSVRITGVLAIVGGLLFLYAGLSTPMKVYRIHLGQAFGFLLVVLIVQSALQVAAVQLSGDPLRIRVHAAQMRQIYALDPGDRAQVVREIRGGFGSPAAAVEAPPEAVAANVPKAAPEAPKSIAERQSELTVLYNELQAKRTALQPGDQAGLDAYTRENARYLELLAQLQKDAAAPEAAAP